MNTTEAKNTLRIMVRGLYDLQKLRIAMGNRIVNNFKVKLGQAPGKPEEELDAIGKRILADLRQSYKKITDGVKTFPRAASFKGDGVIDTYTELRMIKNLLDLEYAEEEQQKTIKTLLAAFPVYTGFLEGVKGVGPLMAGVIISEIDIHKAEYPSSLWAYAGLDVAGDGRGRSRRQEHLVERTYTNKNGKEAKRKGITFNPFLKTKLVGVLASSFLRAGDTPYADIYNAYKHRLEHHAVYGIANDDARKSAVAEQVNDDGEPMKYAPKGHRHNMALRYMIKMFLVDLYKAWRALEGLPVAPPYSEAKLGKVHKVA